MAYTKAAHHRGSHQVTAKRITNAAKRNPATRCWRCHLTMQEIRAGSPTRKPKPRAIWTAGHLVDGQVGGPYAPECSPCNYGEGARRGNAKRALRRVTTPRRTEWTW